MNTVSTIALLVTPLVLGTQDGDQQQARQLTAQAQAAAQNGELEKAERLATAAIKHDADFARAYYVRGRARFRRGRIKGSVEDFDAFVKRQPEQESRQWERGIALYYAGEHRRGADQFALYQTFHDSDVENSAWRYLCMAKTVGPEKAREQLLMIKNDRRVPMMKIYDMYRGKADPQEVLAVARAGDPGENQLLGRLFYAHLYIGLYHEALGKTDLARKHITLAADKKHLRGPINSYMWDVARIHAERVYKMKADKRQADKRQDMESPQP